MSPLGLAIVDELIGEPNDDRGRISARMTHVSIDVLIAIQDDPRVLRLRRCRPGESDKSDFRGERVFVVESEGGPPSFVGSIRAATSRLSVNVESAGGEDAAEEFSGCVATFLDKLADDPVFMMRYMGAITGRCHVCGCEFSTEYDSLEGCDEPCEDYVESAFARARDRMKRYVF